jgi:hypothetical protein
MESGLPTPQSSFEDFVALTSSSTEDYAFLQKNNRTPKGSGRLEGLLDPSKFVQPIPMQNLASNIHEEDLLDTSPVRVLHVSSKEVSPPTQIRSNRKLPRIPSTRTDDVLTISNTPTLERVHPMMNSPVYDVVVINDDSTDI